MFGLIGGLVGGALGAIGGAVGAHQQASAAKRLQKQTREGLQAATRDAELTARNIATSDEFMAVRNLARDVYGLGAVTGEDTFALGSGRIKYGNVLPASKLGTTKFSAIEDQFRKNFTQAQVSRGIYSSNVAAAAEASGMAAWKFQQQKELAPLMMDLAERPTALYHKYLEPLSKFHIMHATGGAGEYQQNQQLTQAVLGAPSALGGGLAGGVGGFMQGAALGGQVQNMAFHNAQNMLAAMQTNQMAQQQGMDPIFSQDYMDKMRRGISNPWSSLFGM